MGVTGPRNRRLVRHETPMDPFNKVKVLTTLHLAQEPKRFQKRQVLRQRLQAQRIYEWQTADGATI